MNHFHTVTNIDPTTASAHGSGASFVSRRYYQPVTVALLVIGFSLFALKSGSYGNTDETIPEAAKWEPIPGGMAAAEAARWRLVWRDEFDATVLDRTKWTAQSGPNRDGQNTPDAVTVHDGVMTITTWSEDGKHFTGYVQSTGKFETTYGYFEARIRFHTTPGQWSAFWMAPRSLGKPLGDVAKAGAEIDVIEHRAVHGVGLGAGNDARNLMAMALHWDGYAEHHQSTGHPGGPAPGDPSLQDHWHTYAVRWTPENYTFYLDGKEQWTTNVAVSKCPEYLLLTSEVQDHFWAGAVPEGGFGSRENSQTKMDVDWVRVWQMADESPNSAQR